MPTVRELKKMARDRKIPNRSKLTTKSEYMQALGITAQPKSTRTARQAQAIAKRHGFAKTHAAEAIGQKLGGEKQKAAIKERILRTVNHALKTAEKSFGRKLTPEEKRSVAASAIKYEVRAIKSGKPQVLGKKKAKKSPSKHDIPDWKKEAIANRVDSRKSGTLATSRSVDSAIEHGELQSKISQLSPSVRLEVMSDLANKHHRHLSKKATTTTGNAIADQLTHTRDFNKGEVHHWDDLMEHHQSTHFDGSKDNKDLIPKEKAFELARSILMGRSPSSSSDPKDRDFLQRAKKLSPLARASVVKGLIGAQYQRARHEVSSGKRKELLRAAGTDKAKQRRAGIVNNLDNLNLYANASKQDRDIFEPIADKVNGLSGKHAKDVLMGTLY